MNEITFSSGRDCCSAWHLQATSEAFADPGGRPCVVMAPGFGGTRDSSLLRYAEGFAAAGMDVLLFDYRGFGESGGSPRQLVSVRRQRGDYHAALAAARRLPGVDPDRIVLWGVSYAGGHVVVVAAQDKRVAAAISLTPAMDGIAILIQLGRNGGPAHLVRAAGNGLRDALRALAGRAPRLVPIVGEPGSNAIIVKAGGEAAFNAIAGPSWRNELCARTALEAGFNRPIRSASRVSCPSSCRSGPATASARRRPAAALSRRRVLAPRCASTPSIIWTSTSAPGRSGRSPTSSTSCDARGQHRSRSGSDVTAMRDSRLPPRLIQIALSVVDLRETERWLREGFGFVPAGGSRRLMRGPLASRIQGLPRVASTCWWLRDRNDWFQIEMFQFERPVARLMPHDARACDLGYTRVGFWVADFDATLARLARIGSLPLSDPIGEPGCRRACVRSPDGVFVEIMEDDPLIARGVQAPARSDCPVAVRSVTLSVADLDQSAAFLSEGLGMPASGAALRRPEHEGLWGLPGAAARSQVFSAGEVLVEVVQYLDPVGRPRPDDYRISDQGILNVAFGARSSGQFDQLHRRACAAGAHPNSTPLRIPGAGVVYVSDPQQFSFELVQMSEASDKHWGFSPIPITRRPQPDTHAIEQTAHVAAPPDVTWQVISDHEAMTEWAGIGPVRRILDGETEPNGRGALRVLHISRPNRRAGHRR